MQEEKQIGNTHAHTHTRPGVVFVHAKGVQVFKSCLTWMRFSLPAFTPAIPESRVSCSLGVNVAAEKPVDPCEITGDPLPVSVNNGETSPS